MNTVEDKLDVSASSASSSAGLGPTLSVARPSPAQSNTDVSKYAEKLIRSANSTASFKDGRCESGMDKMGSVLDITGLIHTWNVRLSFMKGDAPGPKEQEEKQKVQKLPKIFTSNGAVKKFEFGESQEAIRQDSRRRANRRKFTITLNYFGEPEDFTDPRPWVKKFDKNHNPNNKALVYWVRQMQRQDKGHELGPPPPGLDLPCQMARQEEPTIFIGRKNSSIYFAGITKIGDSDTPQVREEAGGAPAEKEARGESPLEALLKPSEKTDSPWTGKESTSKPDDLGGKSGGSSVTREAKGARMTGLFPANDVPSGKRSPKSGSSGGTPETEPAQTKKGARVKPTAVADSYGAANRVKTSILKITVSVTERLMSKNRCLRILNRAVSIVDPIMQSTEAVLVDPTLFVGLIYQVNQTYSTMEASTLGLSRILSGAVSGVVTKVAGLMPLLGATKEGGLPVLTSNAPVDRTDTATSSDNCLMAIRVSPPPSVSAVDVQNATGAQPRSDRPRQKTKLSKGRFPVRGEIPGIKNVMPTAGMPRKASIPCMARNPIRPHTQAQSGKSEKPDSKEVVKVECDAKRSPQKSQKSDEEQKGTIWKVPDRRRRSSLHPPVVQDLKNTLKRREEERQEKKQALPFTSQSSAVSQKSTVAKYEKGKKEDTTSLQTSQAVMKGDAPKTKELEEEEKLQKLEKIPTTNVIEGAVKKYELEERQEKTALAFTPPPSPPSLPGGSAPAQAAPVVYTTQTAEVGQRATVSSREQDVTKISTETATMATMMEAQFAAPPAPPPLPPPDYYLSGGDESDDETPKEQAPPQEAARVYVPPKFLTRFQSQEFRHVEFNPSPRSNAISSVAGSDVGSVRSSRASRPAGTPRSSSPVGRDHTSQGVQSTALASALRDVAESRDTAHGMMQPRRDSLAFRLESQTQETQLKHSTTVGRKTSTGETEDTTEASHMVATVQADRIPSPPPLPSFGLGLLSAHQVSAMSPLSPVTLGQALHNAIGRRVHAVPGDMQASWEQDATKISTDTATMATMMEAQFAAPPAPPPLPPPDYYLSGGDESDDETPKEQETPQEAARVYDPPKFLARFQSQEFRHVEFNPSPRSNAISSVAESDVGSVRSSRASRPAGTPRSSSPVGRDHTSQGVQSTALASALRDVAESRDTAHGMMQPRRDSLAFRLESQTQETQLKHSTTVGIKTSTGETKDTTEASHMVATVQADRLPSPPPLPSFGLGLLSAHQVSAMSPLSPVTLGQALHNAIGRRVHAVPGDMQASWEQDATKISTDTATMATMMEAQFAAPPAPPPLPPRDYYLSGGDESDDETPKEQAPPQEAARVYVPPKFLTRFQSQEFRHVEFRPSPLSRAASSVAGSDVGSARSSHASTPAGTPRSSSPVGRDRTSQGVQSTALALALRDVEESRDAAHGMMQPRRDSPAFLLQPQTTQLKHSTTVRRKTSTGEAEDTVEASHVVATGQADRIPSPPPLSSFGLGLLSAHAVSAMSSLSPVTLGQALHDAIERRGHAVPGHMQSSSLGNDGLSVRLQSQATKLIHSTTVRRKTSTGETEDTTETSHMVATVQADRIPTSSPLPAFSLGAQALIAPPAAIAIPSAAPTMGLLSHSTAAPALPVPRLGGLTSPGLPGGRDMRHTSTSAKVRQKMSVNKGDETVENVAEANQAMATTEVVQIPPPTPLPTPEQLRRPSLPRAMPHLMMHGAGFGRVPSPPALPPMELLMAGISGGFGRVPSPPALPPMELLMTGISGGFGRVPSPPALPPMELLMTGISGGFGRVPSPPALPPMELLMTGISGGFGRVPSPPALPPVELLMAGISGGFERVPSPPALPPMELPMAGISGGFGRVPSPPALPPMELLMAEISDGFGRVPSPPALPPVELLIAGISGGFGRVSSPPALPPMELLIAGISGGSGRVPSPPALPPVELLIAGISGGSGRVPSPPALPPMELLMAGTSGGFGRVPSPPALPPMELLMAGISDGKNVEEAGQTVATMEAGHIPAPLPLPTPEQLGQPITLPQLPQSGPRPIMALMLAEPAGPAIPQPPPLAASLMSPCRDGGTFMRSTTASNKITHNTKATKGDETVENVAEASETVDTMEFGHILEPLPLPTPEQLRRPSLPRSEPHLMMHGAGFGRVPSPPALPPVELLIAGISGGSGGVPFPPALPAIEFLMSEISSTSRQVPYPPALPTMEFLMSGISGFPERDASQASPRPRLDLVGSGAMQPLPDPNRQYTAMSTYAAQESNLSQKRSVTRRDEGTEHSIGTKAAALHTNIPEPPPLPMINYFVPNCDYPRDTFEHQITQTVARFSHRRELFIKLCQDKEDVTDFLIGLEEDESQFSPEVVEEMREEASEELARINASFSELLMTTSGRNQVKDAGGSQCSEELLEPRQVPAERSVPIHHKTPQKDPRTHTCRIHSRSEDSASKIPLVRTPRQTSERKYPYRQPGEKAYSSGKGTRSRGLPQPKVVVTPAMRPQPASETESASGMAEDQSFAPRGRTPLKNVHVRKADGSRSPPGLAAGKTDEQSARGSAETVAKTRNGTVKGGKAGMTRKEYNESGSSDAQAIPSKDAKKTDSVSKDAAAKRFGPEGSTKKEMSSKVKGPQKAGASGTPHTPKKTKVTYKDVRSKLTTSVKVARASSTAKSTHTGSSKSSLHSKDENAPATGPSGQTKESTQDKKENPSLEASQKGANVPKAGPSGVQTAKSAPTKIPQASKDVDAKGTTLAIGRSAMSPRRTDMQATDKTPVKQTAHSPSKIPRPVQRAVKRTVPVIWTKSPGDGEGCGTSMRSTTAFNKMTHKGDETVPVENVAEARETVGTMEVGRIPKPPPLPPPEQLRRPSLPRATTYLMMHGAGFGRVPSPPALPPVELLMSKKMTHKTTVTKGDETVENLAEASETAATMEAVHIPETPPLPTPEQLRRPSTLPQAAPQLNMALQTTEPSAQGTSQYPPSLMSPAHGQGGGTVMRSTTSSNKMTHKTKVKKGDETVENVAEASETVATMEVGHIPEPPPLPTPEQLRHPSLPRATSHLMMHGAGFGRVPSTQTSKDTAERETERLHQDRSQTDLRRTGSSSMAPGATSASYKPPGIEKQVKYDVDRSPVMLPGHVGASTGVRSRPSMPGTGSVPKKLDMEVFDSSEDSEDQIDLDKPVSAEDLEDDQYWQALEKKVYAMVKKSMELETVEEGSAEDETPVQEASSTVEKPSKFSEMFQSRKERERKREREARERAMKEAAGKNEVPHKLDPPTAKPFYGPPLPPEMQKNTPEKKKTGLTRHGHKGKATLVASKAEEEEPSTSKKSGGKLTPSKLVGKIKGGFTRVKDSIKSKLSGEESKFNSETH
ncbi:uncharacterized protein LOC118426886 isoform X2 [Branchiostoma floridae]|uniref:Uncharacterized protein LOC118426886 isoform X2 n=1 Tax=Branchiostoma floridae TaxID=7739 RepID=A0A9J7M095_BRAFL|nr:uncharacterized protein LOC118426886 isoform X2 [Branchiostoma floridae]